MPVTPASLRSPSASRRFANAATPLALTLALGLDAATAQSVTREEVAHVLRHTSYGPTPTQLTNLTTEPLLQAHLTAQLNAPTTGYSAGAQAYMSLFAPEPLPPPPYTGGANHGWDRETLRAKQIVLALTSDHQLRELMTEFWERHFSTGIDKVKVTAGTGELAAVYYEWRENDGFRQRALGNFADLLEWSMESAAMRFYLDSNTNCSNPARGLNENYAREVLELHTLSPGPTAAPHYSNDVDIPMVTLILSGMIVNPDGSPGHLAACHDFGPKVVFANSPVPQFSTPGVVPPFQTDLNVAREMARFRDHLVAAPQTKEFICTKLIEYFVGDHQVVDPTLLTACTNVWGNDGDIKAILGVIFASPQFRNATGAPDWTRVSLPMTRVVSQARILEGSLGPATLLDPLLVRLDRITIALDKIGGLPFAFPSPDGYPAESDAQIGTSITWIYGDYAGRIYADAVATPADQARNLIYDPVTLLQTEVARRNLNFNLAGDVALSGIELQFHSRYSTADLNSATAFLTLDSQTGLPAVWPPTGPNAPTEQDHRCRLMLAFLNTIAQASEK